MPKKKIKKEIKKFEIARRTDLNPENLLPVIQNLTAYGFNLADIGVLLGYVGKDPTAWLYNLRQKYPDVEEALQVGKQLGNIELIKTAIQESLGYWIEEEEIFANNVPVIPVSDKPFGPAKPMQDRYINKSRKTKRKFIQPNTQLLFKLMCCRMPEFFSETHKIQIDKRSIELKGNIEQEIRQFAGALLHVVDAEFEPKETKDEKVLEVQGKEITKRLQQEQDPQ